MKLKTESRSETSHNLLGSRNRRPNSPNPNPTICNLRPRILNLVRFTRVRIARPSNHQDRYSENHPTSECAADSVHAAKSREVVCVVEGGLLLATEGVAYAICRCNGRDLCNAVADRCSVLHVFATDFGKGASIRAIVRDELRDDCKVLVRIYCLVWAIEAHITVAVGIEVAAIFIAKAVDAIGAFAAGMTVD
jgi:hypothetical protein